jgi:GNAT superfamily N-acetyltransferase
MTAARLPPVAVRRAGPDDAAAIAGLIREGFEGYRAFAPDGWEPPVLEAEIARTADRLRGRGAWARLAQAGGATLGVVAFLPHHVEDDLAHFWLLFVTESAWGTGLAARLHDAALEAARGAGYRRMRLYTPEGQARARAFYRRQGWRERGGAFAEPELGLRLLELRRPL